MIDAMFSAYDRWGGVIPLLGGIYATLLAYGHIPRKPKDPERLALWHKKFGPMMKILGPIVIGIGIVTLVSSWQSAREAEAKRTAISMHRQNAGEAGPDGWFLAESTEGNYSVEIPLRFNDYTVKAKEANERIVTTYGLGSTSKEGVTISAAKIPADSRKGMAPQLLSDTRKKGLIVETNTRTFDFQGGHAVEWLEQNSEKASYIRVIDFDQFSIILGITYPRNVDSLVGNIRARFFGSLKIKSTSSPVPR